MKRVLIADDEPGIRRLVRLTLERDDYEIIEASNGDEALAMIRDKQPELVLLDVMMPRRSGLDVCRELKSDDATAGITVVMLTAAAQPSDQEEGAAAGADDYFVKPFLPDDLRSKVESLFDARANSAE